MSNSNLKKLNRFFAVLVFVMASFVLSLGFGVSSFSNFAKAENDNYYVINLTVTNGTANLSYEGNTYDGLDNILVKESNEKYLILKSVVDDAENTCSVKVTVLPNENFVLNQIAVDGTALAESANQTFTIAPATAETNVVVDFVAKTFTVKVATEYSADGVTKLSDNTLLTNNMGVNLDAISVSAHETLFDETNNVVAPDRESDHLEFVGYFISDGMNEVNVSDGRSIASLQFDDEFIAKYVKEGTLEIVARYAYKKMVSVSVDNSCLAFGAFDVVAKNSAGDFVNFVSGEYYSVGTKIFVVPTAEKYYEFSHYEYDGESLYDSNFSATVEYKDVSVVIFFEPVSYEIRFNIVNSVFERLGNEPITLEITHIGAYYNTPVADHVIIGDKIDLIKFKNIFSYQNYKFLSWQLRSKTGDIKNVSDANNADMVKNLDITSDFVDKYVVDGKIDFYGVFIQNCQLSIVMQKAYATENTFQVYEDGVLVEDLSKSFDYGTILTVTVPNIDYMTFVGFDGLIVDDLYTPGQTTAYIAMKGNRSLAVKYDYIKTDIKIAGESVVKNGRLSLSSNNFKIGDTFIINANLSDGYKIKSFTVNGKSAEQFVRELNAGEEKPVANYGENGIITIHVNKNVYDFFVNNDTLNVKVDSKINGAYVALFVIYLLLALGFGAVIVVLSIMTNNNSEEIKKLRKKQQDAVLKKEEEQRKEEERQKALLEKQKEEIVAEKAFEEKPKKAPAKKIATKKVDETEKPKAPAKKTTTKSAGKTATKTAEKPKTAKTASKPATKKATAEKADKPAPKKRTTKPKETNKEGGEA